MSTTPSPVSLTAEQVTELHDELRRFRHDMNNRLGLIIAAAEILQRKPETFAKLARTFLDQPQTISQELYAFSDRLEKALGVAPPPE